MKDHRLQVIYSPPPSPLKVLRGRCSMEAGEGNGGFPLVWNFPVLFLLYNICVRSTPPPFKIPSNKFNSCHSVHVFLPRIQLCQQEAYNSINTTAILITICLGKISLKVPTIQVVYRRIHIIFSLRLPIIIYQEGNLNCLQKIYY